jgi:hypothetical protein
VQSVVGKSLLFVLSIFGQFDYELETRLLKSENRFHAQHLLPRAVDKLTGDHIATIYPLQNLDEYAPIQGKIACQSSLST